MIRETTNTTGKLRIVLTGKDGEVKQDFVTDNEVVNPGLDHIAARLKDNGIPAQMDRMAVGSDNTAATLADSALGTELGRVFLNDSGGVVTSNDIVYTGVFPAGTGTGALTEAGIFNGALGADDMLCRTVFSTVNKGADDTVTITWTVTINS